VHEILREEIVKRRSPQDYNPHEEVIEDDRRGHRGFNLARG
jgi:hypothetical protein